ncbi:MULTISPECIES: hypothetical protein [unclassified Thiocapsa]|uniref:hypothetical protein n=1 Tax=unclassified Thiocapsa TaxID=2641286 RepID=UPI0035B3A60F
MTIQRSAERVSAPCNAGAGWARCALPNLPVPAVLESFLKPSETRRSKAEMSLRLQGHAMTFQRPAERVSA